MMIGSLCAWIKGVSMIAKKFKSGTKGFGVKIEYCGINCLDDRPYIESFSLDTSVKRFTATNIALLPMPCWDRYSISIGIRPNGFIRD